LPLSAPSGVQDSTVHKGDVMQNREQYIVEEEGKLRSNTAGAETKVVGGREAVSLEGCDPRR
jgi:hypothetical protein